MQPFYQSLVGTINTAPPELRGDCMRTAVASILEIDPRKLPNPHETGLDWGLEWMKALAPYGVQPIWIGDMKAWWELGFAGYWLATVLVEGEDAPDDVDSEAHAVVMLHDQLAHDPMPDSTTWTWSEEKLHKAILSATIFVPIDPRRGVAR